MMAPQQRRDTRRRMVLFLLCWVGVLSTLSTTQASSQHTNSLRISPLRTSPWGRTTISQRRNGFITRRQDQELISQASADSVIWKLRAGASVDVADDDKDKDDDKDEDDDKKENDDTSSSSDTQSDLPHSVLSNEPITVTVYTSMGSRLVDVSWEGTTTRSRNVGDLKRIVAKGLPGRPPEAVIQFRFHGRLLQDDHELVDELMNEQEEEGAVDDDDDEEETSSSSDPKLALQLDMIPPVDPKFGATYFSAPQPLTTLELFEAYVANAAAMYTHSQLILREEEKNEKVEGADGEEGENEEATTTSTVPTPSSTTTSLTVQLQQRARLLRQDLQATFPEKVQTLLQQAANGTATTSATDPAAGAAAAHTVVQRRGQRYRVSGGARTNVKRMIRRNLNLNWPDTFRNVCLFLFFGFFGGRSPWSKYLLLLGAPMSILLQARPVKYLIKRLFYSLVFPPAVFLSLLPAPQQAILNYNAREAFAALYPTLAAQHAKLAAAAAKAAHADQGVAAAASQASKVAVEEEEDDDEEEDDEEEDDE